MVKLFKRALAVVLCAALLVGIAPLSGFVFRAEAAGYKVGDTLVFGSYPQSAAIKDTLLIARLAVQPHDARGVAQYDGKEYIRIGSYYYEYLPIEWRILSVNSDGVYVMAEKVLDYHIYHSTEPATWGSSSLRQWLNGEFYNRAFTNSEKEKINYTHLVGDNTWDNVWIPSHFEVINTDYGFVSEASRKASATPFAAAKSNNAYWWTRTIHSSGSAKYVPFAGNMRYDGRGIKENTGIRPALILNLTSLYQSKSNGLYVLKAVDSTTNQPLSDVSIIYNGNSVGTTSSDGSYVLSVGDNPDSSAEVRFVKDGYTSTARRLYELNPYGQNTIPLKSDFDISEMLAGIALQGETIYGPTVNILGHSFPLFSFEGGLNLGSLSFKYKHDTQKKTVKYVVGIKDGVDIGADNESVDYSNNYYDGFNETYDDFKAFFQGLSDETNYKNYWRYTKIKDKLKKIGGSLGVSADLSVAGYLEFDYSTGDLVFKDGGMVVTAEASLEEDVPFWGICYANFKISGEIEGKLSAALQDSGFLQMKGKIGFDIKPSMAAGVKLLSKKIAYAEARIEGNISGSVKFPASSFAQAAEFYLSAQCSVKAKEIGLFEQKWSTNFRKLELYPNFGQLVDNSAGAELVLNSDGEIVVAEDQNDLELIDRSYLKGKNSSGLLALNSVSDGAGDLNESSVYPYGSPKLVRLNDGRIVALFLYDDGTKSDINRTTLYYSVYENGLWSQAAPVNNSGFADFPAEVCTDGATVYAVWGRANQVLSDSASVDDVLDKTELVYAAFDGAGWSAPTVLDTAGNYQMLYSIAEHNGEVAVLWAENSENDYMLSSGSTTLYYRTLSDGAWSGSVTAATNSGIADAVIGYEAGAMKALYSLDGDGDLTTTGDSELYLNGVKITDNDVDEGELTYQNGSFYWIQNGELYTTGGATGAKVESDYRVLTTGGATAVTSLLTDGFKSELAVSYLIGSTYTQPVALTSYGKNISYYDAILNSNGTVSLLADVENLNDGEGYPYTTTDMVCDILSGRTDLAVSNVYADGTIVRGGEAKFCGTVTNCGTTPVNSYTVAFKNANGNVIRSADYNETLQPGESADFEVVYNIPDTFTKQTVNAQVTAANDADATNDSEAFTIGYADIEVIDAAISESGVITATVVNNGCEAAQNVTVKVSSFKAEETELATLNVGGLDVGETKTVTYTLSGSDLAFDSSYVVNKFLLRASSDTEEENLANNETEAIYAPKPVESIALNNSTLSLNYGDAAQLTAAVYPSDAYNQNVHWLSDSVDVATVDQNGNITTVGAGTAIITAITDDGGFVAQCEVTVAVRATGVVLNNSQITLNVGSTVTLTANVTPDATTNKTVSWTSSDSSVATVDESGVVRGLKTGTAAITARTSDGGFEASCTVNVINPVNGITISENNISLYTGKTRQLYAAVTPADADNQQIVWSTDNDNVAEVSDSGLVTAVGSGTATITAMAVDGHYTATCTVTVGKHVTSVFISDSTLSLPVGFSEQLTATVFPFSALNKTVYWMSTNTKVATVDENGVVTAVKAGSTTIIVYSEDGEYAANCTVTVTNSVGGFSLTDDEVYIARNGSKQLTGVFTPATAENQNVTWTSTNTAIATVDENGLVTGRMAGTAMIVATTEDGGFKDYCSVKVIGVDAISTAHIDFNSGVITGLNANLDSLDDYITVSESGCALQYESLSTNSVVYLTRNDEIIDAYTVVIFGDVDGNGWYDGTDAYFVKLVVSGMVSASALTEAQRMAADCNHDGRIDGLDVATLEQAGLLLAQVNQNAAPEELETNSAYLDYCSLIDQTVEIVESDQPAASGETAEEPARAAANVWQIMINLFKRIISLVINTFFAGIITK